MKKHILVTGAAGFIGFHLCKRLLNDQCTVVGVDNLNEYYDVRLKRGRLEQLLPHESFSFLQIDISDRKAIEKVFQDQHFDRVINLAAQAGVRYSIINPHSYIDTNIKGFLHILEGCRHAKVPHLVFASSSSVYGLNTKMPFSVHHNVDHPISLYAATKKSNELMAHTYSYVYGMPITGLRFFTVYGPWGRPDMALFLFTRAILEGRPIKVFNYGEMKRDFTYVDDSVEGVVRVMDRIPEPNKAWNGNDPDPGSSPGPFRVYNIGNHNPVKLMDFIEAIEKVLQRKADKEFEPMQPGDVPVSFADVEDLEKAIGFRPKTSIQEGIKRFVTWYLEYYHPGAAGSKTTK